MQFRFHKKTTTQCIMGWNSSQCTSFTTRWLRLHRAPQVFLQLRCHLRRNCWFLSRILPLMVAYRNQIKHHSRSVLLIQSSRKSVNFKLNKSDNCIVACDVAFSCKPRTLFTYLMCWCIKLILKYK